MPDNAYACTTAELQSVARALGIARYTQLQETAFSHKDVLDGEDIFVVGATSSGKTLIPILLYLAHVVRALKNHDEPPRLLFVVPYRSLAAQKTIELAAQFTQVLTEFGFETPLACVQSTGEYRADDLAVQRAEVHVAVVITEKIYHYASLDRRFLSTYDYLVLDEAGLVDSSERGARLDFIFSWASQQREIEERPRTIALATPSFCWDAYIDAYGFTPIQVAKRPVPLEEHVVHFHQNNNKSYYFSLDAHLVQLDGARGDGEADATPRIDLPIGYWCYPKSRDWPYGQSWTCHAHTDTHLACPITEECRLHDAGDCPHINGPCNNRTFWIEDKDIPAIINHYAPSKATCSLIARICAHHVEQGHQVLVFKNNREDVRHFARLLWKSLGERLIDQRPDTRSIARDPKRARDHILATISEETGSQLTADDVYGILEGPDWDLELYQALAAGIGFHSASVPNELRTYIEKHLLDTRDLSIVCCTETLAYGVNSSVDAVIVADITKQIAGSSSMLTLNEYQNYIGRAGRLRISTATADSPPQRGWSYVLLNNSHVNRETKQTQAERFEELQGEKKHPRQLYSSIFDADTDHLPFFLLNLVPSEGATTWKALREACARLPMPPERRADRGFVDRFYENIDASLDYLEGQRMIVKVDGYGARDAEGARPYGITERGKKLKGFTISKADYERLRTALNDTLTWCESPFDEKGLLEQLVKTKHLRGIRNNMKADDADKLVDALLSWKRGDSPGAITRTYGIPHALVQKAAEQIAYLLEIGCKLCEDVVRCYVRAVKARATGRDGNQTASQLAAAFLEHCTEDSTSKLIGHAEQQLKELHDAIMYGIDPETRSILVNELRASGDPRGAALAREYDGGLDPLVARKLRYAIVRYRFLSASRPQAGADRQDEANYNDQLSQYKRDIHNMEPALRDVFIRLFINHFPSK